MADISPFLSTPGQWIERLAQLRAERQKIEDQEDRLKTKLRAHLDENKLEELAADNFVAKIERRESTDFSQKALTEALGEKKFAALKAALPVKTSEALTIREIKKDEAPTSDKQTQILEHFGASEKKGAARWQKS